jgi:hypothetical protein
MVLIDDDLGASILRQQVVEGAGLQCFRSVELSSSDLPQIVGRVYDDDGRQSKYINFPGLLSSLVRTLAKGPLLINYLVYCHLEFF